MKFYILLVSMRKSLNIMWQLAQSPLKYLNIYCGSNYQSTGYMINECKYLVNSPDMAYNYKSGVHHKHGWISKM